MKLQWVTKPQKMLYCQTCWRFGKCICVFLFLHIDSAQKIAAVQLVKDQALKTPLHIFPIMVRYICRYPVLISSLTEILAVLKYCWCQLWCMLWRLCTKWPCMMAWCGDTVKPRFHKMLKYKCHSDEIFISGCTRSCHSEEMQKYICLYLQAVEIHSCDRLDLAILCCLCHGCWWLVMSHHMWYWSNLHRVIQIWARYFFSDNQKWSIKKHFKSFVWKTLSFCRHFHHVFSLMTFYCIYF